MTQEHILREELTKNDTLV